VQIALELLDRVRHKRVQHGWLTFDAWYGMHAACTHAFEERGIKCIGEVPGHLLGWIKALPAR